MTFLLAAAVGCAGQQEGGSSVQATDPLPVRTVAATFEERQVWIEATGTVQAWARIEPGSRLPGRVAEVTVREGDRVAAGDLLVRLDDADLRAGLAEAEAAVALAEARLEQARLQDERMQRLLARGSATDKEMEDARAAHRVQAAMLAQAQARRDTARVQLGYARIVAPVESWVTERRVEPGDTVVPGAGLMALEDLSRVKVLASVAEADAAPLAPGTEARLRIVGFADELSGVVDRLLPAADPVSRTLSVRIVLDNPGLVLRSGLFARVRFAAGRSRALTVPLAALVRRGAMDGVFVVEDDDMARLRWLRVGTTEGDRVAVVSGLAEGEQVVVDPPATLADGAPVRPDRTRPAPDGTTVPSE